MKQIERIQKMEKILNDANAIMDQLEEVLEQYRQIQEDIDTLDTYYQSELWRQDFEDDRKGRIPVDLPRGILSEDGIYDMLTRNDALKIHIEE